MKKPLLLLLLFLTLSVFSQKIKNDYIIASGSRGGNYFKIGNFISHQYNKHLSKYHFRIIETNGSNENIELLKNNTVDFAIVQRDILLKNLYDENKGTKNVTVISPLYQEKLWIYYRGKKDLNITKLDSLFKAHKYKIGFTSKKGYSCKIFNNIVRLLNIDIAGFEQVSMNYNDLTENLINDSLHFVVSFSLPLQKLDSLKDIHKLYLSKSDADFIENRIPNIYTEKIGHQKYSLGSWTFLIGSKTSIADIKSNNALLYSLFEKTEKTEFKIFERYALSSYNKFIQNNNHELKQLKSIPVFRPLKSKIFFKSINWSLYLYLFLIFLLLIAVHYYYTGKWLPKYNLIFFWNRYKHFQFGFIVLILIYFSSVEWLVRAERKFYLDTGIKSQILNMPKSDLHSWILVTTVTGNSNGIFPMSLTGKIMLALNSLNFWIGTILIGISEYFTYKVNQKRKKGLMKTKYNNHLVIFGWNHSTPKFIIEIIQDAKTYNDTQIKIVLVVADIKIIREHYPDIKELHDNKIIDIIEGDARDTHVLKKSNIENVHTIVLLSEGNSLTSDEHVLLRALAITRYTKKLSYLNTNQKKNIYAKTLQLLGLDKLKQRKNKENSFYYNRSYIIAEINNEEFRESLIDADVNEIVIAGNYRKAIMKQSIFNHGISKVLDEIMQYNEHNEFYKINLAEKENDFLRGKTYDEILILLRKKGILLIGIHIIFYEENTNKIIIDQNNINQLLQEQENGIKRDIILNPVDDRERNRKTDDNDHLIVLAINVKMLRKGIAELKKEIINS